MRLTLALRLGIVVLTCALLWAAVLWLVPGAEVARANPGALFVSVTGSGSACSQAAPCDLQTALAQAAEGDTLYVGAGTYTGSGDAVATIARSVTVYGGWDGAASGPVVCDPSAYPTTLDGQGQRRVVYANSGLTVGLEGLAIANGYVVGDGGGLYASGVALTLRGMTFEGNVITTTNWASGGGAFVERGSVLVEASTFRRNWGWAPKSAYGAGLAISRTAAATVTGCLFDSNDSWTGSGAYLLGINQNDSTFLLSDSTFVQNGRGLTGVRARGGYGGAFVVWTARARIERNTIRGNGASNDWGAVGIGGGAVTLEGNIIVGNWNGTTAGLYLTGVRPYTVTNNIIAGNETSWRGQPAVRLVGGSGQFVHNTIAHNAKSGGIQADSGATVWITNTIVVSHTVGISVGTGSTLTMEATMWGSGIWANGTDWVDNGRLSIGTVYVRGDPDFVNPAVGDYHIGGSSMAIDTGVPAGVAVDIDGDPRPFGAGYDIGADEYDALAVRRYVYLPVVRRRR